MERSPSPSPRSDGGVSGGRWSLEEGAEEDEQSHAPPLSFSQSSSTAAASSTAAGSEDEEEAAATVADGEPPLLEEEWGEGVDGDEYYGAVVWQGQRFRVGDCVEVILEGEPQPSQGRGRSKAVVPADSRAYGEVVWLFRRPKQQQQGSCSSQGDDEQEEEEEEDMEVIAEVRWFNTPAELLSKPEDRAKCLMRELFEGDRVDEVPVEAFNDRVRVVAPRHVPRYPHEEVFVCRRLFVSRQRAFLPLGHRALQPKARRARALSYSARRDQAPRAQVEMALRAATVSAMEEEEEEEASDGEGSGNSRRRSSLSSSSSCSQGEWENANPNVGGGGEGKGAKQRGWKRRRAGGEGEGEEEEGNEALSLLSQAEARLHLSSSPWTAETKAPSLPCRERETQEVMDFLLASLADFYRNSGGGGQGRSGGSRGGGGKSASGGVAPSSSRGGLYIAGFPGTGKTATVHHVLGRLRRERKDLPFTHVEVNGLALPTPAQAYPILWAALTDQKEAGLPPARACARLADFFTSTSFSSAASSVTATAAASRVRRSRPVVLVLDEMDYVVGGSGSGIDAKVIYNLLEWGAGGDGGRRGLIMIGLSNTVDLPERVMQPRVQSRLSLRRVRFEPYTHLQVASILKARLSGGLVPLVLDEQGIGMCARKVANVSGDLRKAFQVCRHAIDLKRRLLKNPPPAPPPPSSATAVPTEKEAAAPTTEKEGGPLVKIELINQAARELQEKPIFKAMQEGLSNVQVLLLVSIVRATMESGRLEAPFPEVYRRWLAALQKMHEIPAGVRPAYGEALEVAHRLALDGFLRLSRTLQGPGSAAPLVALQLQPGDVAEAVRKGRPQELYELLPAELRQWHGR